MTIIPLPAFRDNYIWLMHDGRHALVVDPGDAQPVIDHLEREQLQLAAILITHHHADHVGGLRSLLAHAPVPVFGPAHEDIDGVDHRLVEGDREHIAPMNLDFDVLDIPAHTAGHIAFVTPDGADTNNPITSTIEVYAINRLMDCHAFPAAAARIRALFASQAAINGIHRNLLRCDLAFCCMLLDDTDAAKQELDEPLRKFMQSMKRFPSVLRTQYAEALLLNRDPAKADAILAKFDRMAKKYPYESDIASERELIQAAQEKHAQNKT